MHKVYPAPSQEVARMCPPRGLSTSVSCSCHNDDAFRANFTQRQGAAGHGNKGAKEGFEG